MNTIYLSVFVPTLPRKGRIQELVAALYESVCSLDRSESELTRGMIEVVISCNEKSSQGEVYNYILRNFPDFEVRCVSPFANIGADNNIKSAALLTSGKYVWILCDDDIPSSTAIETILSTVIKHDPALLYLEPLCVNAYEYKQDYGNSLPSTRFVNEITSLLASDTQEQSLSPIDDNWLTDKCEDLLRASCLVFRRSTTHSYWQSFYGERTHVASLCLALDALSGGQGYWLKKPIYAYIDAYNEIGLKKAWYIYYFQVLPTAAAFLSANQMVVPARYTVIPVLHIKLVVKSLFYAWTKSPRLTDSVTIVRYCLSSFSAYLKSALRQCNKRMTLLSGKEIR
jgi:hypothetical protein